MIEVRNDIKYQYNSQEALKYKPVLKDALKNAPSSYGYENHEYKQKVCSLVLQRKDKRNLAENMAYYIGKSIVSF